MDINIALAFVKYKMVGSYNNQYFIGHTGVLLWAPPHYGSDKE